MGGLTPTPSKNRSISKAALGAEERVDWAWTANSLQTVRELKAEGFKALALECLPDASNLFEINPGLLTGEKWLIILGSEPAGIDPGLVELADISVFIPMGGEKSSLNVSVAFGIAVYGLRFMFNR
ncbi:MAG: RNA methyltransferase [Chloroflexi bacterium]|nr:RNA methyltransferase [Chloroflexota bacterium]